MQIKKVPKDKLVKYLIEKDFVVEELNNSVIRFQKNLMVGAVKGIAVIGKFTYTRHYLLGSKSITNEDDTKTKIFLSTGVSSLGTAILALQFLILVWIFGLGIITTLVLYLIFISTATAEVDKIQLMFQKEFI